MLILKSCQATQWVGDITGAMADGHKDRRLQRGSTLGRCSSQSHSPPVASLNWKVGVSNGDQGMLLFPEALAAPSCTSQVWAVDVTASLFLLRSWQETVTQSASPVPTLKWPPLLQ